MNGELINWDEVPKSVNCVLVTTDKNFLAIKNACFLRDNIDVVMVGVSKPKNGVFYVISDSYLSSFAADGLDMFHYRPAVESKQESIDNTLSERGSRYGRFEDGAEIMQHFKEYARNTPGWNKMKPIQRESLDMIFHKIGRILNGDPDYADSWHDVCGFSKLVDDYLNGSSK